MLKESRIAVFALIGLTPGASAAERRVPFWPDATIERIQAQVDGALALETVRELSRFHRVHGSPGFAAAAEHIRRKAASLGLEASIERFPADGSTRYAHFRSYYGWTPESASLDEVSPIPRPISRFPENPLALADYSQDADATAQLVDVGSGTRPEDFDGKSVRGKIVLASGGLPAVHRRAVEERGALGFLSDYPNQTTAWSGDDRDLQRWGHLSAFQTKNTFAFMLSKRQADLLRARLRGGETIVLRARVKARMGAASFDIVNAFLPGSDPAAGEVVLTAHLCHQSAGANDDASGSAAILEVLRSLKAAIDAGLPAPRRGIRVLWLPEIAGSQAWLVRNPETAKRLVAGIHMDMVGGLLATTRGTFHLSRTAESLPHAANAVAQAFFDDVVSQSARHAERGGDPRAGLVWAPGSREAFLGDVRALELGSDHEVFEEASFGVPMLYFHDWPDVTIHTSKDQPENLDPTKLGRVAYLGAGIAYTLAALPDAEAPRLLAAVRADGESRIVKARLRGAAIDDARDAALFEREAREQAVFAVRSVARLWPAAAIAAKEAEAKLALPSVPGAPPRDPRVPVRSPEVRGPLGVYYYDHLVETLGADADVNPALERRSNGGVLFYELLNLVDGKRSVAEIRDILSGRYEPIPLSEVGSAFDLLARARVVSWR